MNDFSVQHYMFRPLANEEGLFPVLTEIADMGYSGVEMCCFGGFEQLNMSAKEFGARMRELGLKFIGNHFTRQMFSGSYDEAFAYIAEAGGRYAMYNIWADYNTEDDVSAAAEFLNSLAAIARREGLSLLYHNHDAEFADMNGRLIIDRLFDELDSNIYHEADVFFMKKQGIDVYGYLKEHAERVRAVHLKQISDTGRNVDLADGIIDMSEVVRCTPHATDYIVEQAEFDVSIRESLKRNAEFMKKL